ncbi:MAG: HAD hydrolase-like protein [Bacteroidales bacterium]|nr:HAD hydrolase-like protein [Bacteroidales bacterium]MBR1571086.1 HAD hydrolase-like protein [Bacteroidales bacterium]
MELSYRLVLFDLDGTLIDTIEDLGDAVNHALSLRGFPLHSQAEYRRMVGHGVRNLVTQALPDNLRADETLIDAALADFKAWYTAHIDVHTRPYPGMQALLKDLDAAGVKMAVTSNKFQSGTEKLIREFFPEISFVSILGNREGFPLKPDPEIVGEVLRAAGSPDGKPFPREEAVLVGDSLTDMKTALNGGIRGIAVGWGYRPMEATEDYSFAGSVTELRTLLFARPFFVSDPVPTPPAGPLTPLQTTVYGMFARLNIPFTRVDTDPGITMEDCRHIDEKIGVRIVKTVFVCNRQQTEFYLYVTTGDKPFVTREFCAALGIPRVSFASADKLMALTGVEVGATTILSAAWPEAAGVHLVMDRAVAESPWFACTDGTDTCFVRLRTQDLLEKYLPASGHSLTVI